MYFYYLDLIKPLLKDMGLNNVRQDKFSFRYNRIKFDVVVLIDRVPFKLLFGIIDKNFSFALNLFKGYKLEYLSDDVFFELCKILELKPNKDGLTSFKFFNYFASKIPNKYSGRKIQPDEIAIYRKKYIDESEKIYFKGWLHHFEDGKRVQNLEKTRELLGEDAYLCCKEYNISSRWSDKPTDKTLYYPPEKYLNKKIKQSGDL